MDLGVLETVGRAAGRAAAKATHGARMTPSYLIVGGKRCGTTSLQRYLASHPSIAAPLTGKGSRYFDVNYDRGPAWLRAHFPLEVTASWRGEVVTGEASPYYCFHPDAPRRIAAEVPEARLIMIVRDPVDRAVSHHAHEVANGFEDLPFEAALDAELTRTYGERERLLADPAYVSFSHRHHSYLERGHYADQIEGLLRHFPREQLLVIDLADLTATPDEAMRVVTDFVGVPPFAPGTLEMRKHNSSSPAPISPATRDRLVEHYRPHNERLFNLLGRAHDWLC